MVVLRRIPFAVWGLQLKVLEERVKFVQGTLLEERDYLKAEMET